MSSSSSSSSSLSSSSSFSSSSNSSWPGGGCGGCREQGCLSVPARLAPGDGEVTPTGMGTSFGHWPSGRSTCLLHPVSLLPAVLLATSARPRCSSRCHGRCSRRDLAVSPAPALGLSPSLFLPRFPSSSSAAPALTVALPRAQAGAAALLGGSAPQNPPSPLCPTAPWPHVAPSPRTQAPLLGGRTQLCTLERPSELGGAARTWGVQGCV